MFLKKRTLAVSLLAACLSSATFASSPLGIWKTVDDSSGEAKSYVTIYEENGKVSGKVTQILDPAKQDSICDQCKGDLKDQKIQGMTILWGMEKQGSKYDDGKIVDPESGKVYSANMKVLEDGKKLEVRGYIGFSLIGRSQTWERVEE
ncbi:DUF2147 domain-containing protein [Endozoicomonas elysicola]|uniref:Signal peptide protein n=1 Tax=Endozoicomonas elysicola TaxID=305900 RepID=A0A081KCE3_9GAMM|nr:DUF2147 domain-containing protein [Endozoicomonas elysicola]KEI71819.1 signal peptide protein [Endozoicomonas elysicola]